MAQNQDEKSYKDSLNLPKTDFPIRANPKDEDKIMLARWEAEKLSNASFSMHEGREKFILHDGPPYANGNIHLGHALNKILKDIVGKSQRMLGKHVPIIPGWDCHGLPIELKVTQEQSYSDPVTLKKACRDYAQQWIEVQRESFKQLGVLMHWDAPYLTMDFTYEASILRVFGTFVKEGYIERNNKAVPWCSSCQTVLASAEIEYVDRKDPSVYTQFTLTDRAIQELVPSLSGKSVDLIVWTTTPWTLPLNRAVLLKPQAEYVVLDVNGQYLITAAALSDAMVKLLQVEKVIVASFMTDAIVSSQLYVKHSFIDNVEVPIILDHSVSLEDGSAIVHCAPGCGPEDYTVGVKNKLEIFSPISADGKYTEEVELPELIGMPVSEGQWWVLRTLQSLGKLLYKGTINHSYPHCWRCHNGLIFRATKQWFCDLSKNDLKKRTIEAIDACIETIPEKSINRLKATLEGRLEWCLSRQRVWGVSIPAIVHDKTDYVYCSPEFIEMVASHVEKHGTQWWDTASIEELLPKDFDIKRYPLQELRKETDILDVWFESGVSFYAVLLQRKQQQFPADIYLEGSDQHRAWFQSSILISMVLKETPPMKQIMTHGFTVDEKGRKMSKSLGNVVSPQEIVDQLGVDGLRLWVSSVDTSGDAVISKRVIENVKEVYRKIRNTARFLLSNLYDFNIEKDAIAIEKCLLVDRYALQEVALFNTRLLQAYKEMNFNAIFHLFADYSTVTLSSFYLDIIKDRLYVEQADGFKRRSAQTACWYILDNMTRLMAPILSFTAEQLSDHYQILKTSSIHLQTFADLPFQTLQIEKPRYDVLFTKLKEMRSVILKAIEKLREESIIKHSLEARVTLCIDAPLSQEKWFAECKLLLGEQAFEEFLKEFLIVSQVELKAKKDYLHETSCAGLYVLVEHARGVRCPRCWQWQEASDDRALCYRCSEIVNVKL